MTPTSSTVRPSSGRAHNMLVHLVHIIDTHARTHARTHTGLMPGCPALQYLVLDAKIARYMPPAPPNGEWALQRLLSAALRLFYVLTVEGDWNLTSLPSGWETHTVPLERLPGEPPLILQPRGVFSRPSKVRVSAEERLVVLFHHGRSPVRIGEDGAEWRWVHPKRPIVVGGGAGSWEADDDESQG